MKASELYLIGAEKCAEKDEEWNVSYVVERNDFPYACDSIRGLVGSNGALKEFAEYFKPEKGDWCDGWFGSVSGKAGAHNSHYRVIALSFMAVIAKSEGR